MEGDGEMAFEVLRAEDLYEYVRKKEYVIVDLRSAGEYQKGHVEGAINIPYEKFENNNFYLPKYKRIIVYCERGAASFLVARKLYDRGYQVYTVIGGYQAISKEIH